MGMQWGSGWGSNGPKHFTLEFDNSGTLTTRICNLDGSGCFNGASYNDFLNRITSKHAHHFVSDIWNGHGGHGGDPGWAGCHAKNSPGTNCHYAIMNLRVSTNNGQPLYGGKCAVLNGGTSPIPTPTPGPTPVPSGSACEANPGCARKGLTGDCC